jgi:hypothetical protein
MFRRAAPSLTAHVRTTALARPIDEPSPHGRVVDARGEGRCPHVFPLLFGLIDARVGGVDCLDTIGGDELMRLLRGWGAVHQGPVHRSDAHGEKEPGG